MYHAQYCPLNCTGHSNWGQLPSCNASQKNQLDRLGKPPTLSQLSMSIEFGHKASKIEHWHLKAPTENPLSSGLILTSMG